MVRSGGDPAPYGVEGPNNTRVLIIAAAIAAALSVVVAIGLFLRAGQDGDDPRNPAPSYTTRPTDPASLSPVRTVGGDCSAGGIVARWELQDGQLMCVPEPQRADPRRVGGDCSHSGLVAEWGRTTDGQWICIPQAPRQVGDDCSHDGIAARWDRTPEGWNCVPQQQVAAAPAPPPAPVAPAPQPAPGPWRHLRRRSRNPLSRFPRPRRPRRPRWSFRCRGCPGFRFRCPRRRSPRLSRTMSGHSVGVDRGADARYPRKNCLRPFFSRVSHGRRGVSRAAGSAVRTGPVGSPSPARGPGPARSAGPSAHPGRR